MSNQEPILTTSDLTVRYFGQSAKTALDKVTIKVYPSEILAITGESGCGKTTLAKAIMQLLPKGAEIQSGDIRYVSTAGDTISIEQGGFEENIKAVRGNEIGMVFQEPSTHLNPTSKCGDQILESYLHKYPNDGQDAKERVLQELGLIGFSDPTRIYEAYPSQLSGGEAQRVMLVMVGIQSPRLILADEPTASVDVVNRKTVFDYLQNLKQRTGCSVIVITHDLGIGLQLANRVCIMNKGRIVEVISTQSNEDHYNHKYTNYLFDQWKKLQQRETKTHSLRKGDQHKFLEVRNLVVDHLITDTRSLFRKKRYRAVNDISFSLFQGTILGILGKSGSGKTSLIHCLTGLLPSQSGKILKQGFSNNQGSIQLVFQHPAKALSPSQKIGEGLKEVILANNQEMKIAATKIEVAKLMEQVNLSEELLNSYPSELSGGEKQRVCIARVLATRPELIIFDEATSALDAPIKTEVLELLLSLKNKLNLTYVFISHDFSVIRFVADNVIVMHEGKIVENNTISHIIQQPQHDITKELTTQHLAQDD